MRGNRMHPGFFRLASFFLYSLLLFVLWFAGSAEGLEGTAERIQKAYEEIKDIKGNFVQRSHIRDLKRTDIFKGTFSIKVPSKMRWQYTSDHKQHTEVTIRNDEIIIYQKNEKQAFRSRFDRESYGQAPIALLGGFGNIEREFDLSEKDGKVILTPKKGMGAVVSIEIVPSDGAFPIASLSIIDRRSNRIDITFKDVTLNAGIRDSFFEFSLPKDVSVYDYNQPQ
jgi:outer membrane lipoprotein-sorting protein